MKTCPRWVAWAVLALACGLAEPQRALGAEAEADAAPQEITSAIWKDQEIDFTYRSTLTVYSCSALQARVKTLLRAVGADPALKVSVNGCTDFFVAPPDPFTTPGRNRPADRFSNIDPLNNVGRQPQFAHIRIRLRSPVAATPDVLAELEKTRPFRELLGRVTGSSATIQEAASQFPARYEQVTLSYRSLRLEPEECELVEQMITDVFPKLNVKVVKRASLICNPRQATRLKPKLVVEALIRTPAEEPLVAKPEEPAPADPAPETPSETP